MIQLNLLPHRLEQQRAAIMTLRQRCYWTLGSSLLLSSLITLGLWAWLQQQQQRNAYVQMLIQTATPAAQASQKLSDQIDVLRAQRQTLAQRLSQQAYPWFLLTQLQTTLPNSLHLTSLSWQQPYLALEGVALSHEAIILFVGQLNQASWLTQATLLSSQQQDGVWVFALSAQSSETIP